ncbi:MAG: hypothetical protein IPI34_15020 [bacterium]|nr:hypothetical protein [bacterium]
MTDAAFCEFAVDELASIDIIDKADVLDSTIIRVRKTYPAYFGSYDRFQDPRVCRRAGKPVLAVGRNGVPTSWRNAAIPC